MDDRRKMRFKLKPLHHCLIIPRFAIVTGMGMEQIAVDGNKLSDAWKPPVGHVAQAVFSQVLGSYM